MSHARIRSASSADGMTAWDYGAVITLATVGFTLSYDALRQVAVAIHVRPQLSYLFPVAIDGFIAYGVRAIVLLRDRPFGARLYAWFLFLAATGASLWANALHAITLNHGTRSGPSALRLGDSVVGVLSTLAPLALAGSVHLWIIMTRTAESSVPDRSESGPGPVRSDATSPVVEQVGSEASVPGKLHELGPLSGPSAADGPDEAPADQQKGCQDKASTPMPPNLDDRIEAPPTAQNGEEEYPSGPTAVGAPDSRTAPDSSTASASPAGELSTLSGTGNSNTDDQYPSVPDGNDAPQDREPVDAWMTPLLPIAREASRRAGRISRSAVAEAVRAQYPISNDRLGELITHLKKEKDEERKPVPASAGGGLW